MLEWIWLLNPLSINNQTCISYIVAPILKRVDIFSLCIYFLHNAVLIYFLHNAVLLPWKYLIPCIWHKGPQKCVAAAGTNVCHYMYIYICIYTYFVCIYIYIIYISKIVRYRLIKLRLNYDWGFPWKFNNKFIWSGKRISMPMNMHKFYSIHPTHPHTDM